MAKSRVVVLKRLIEMNACFMGLNVKPPYDDAKKYWSSLNTRPLRIHS